MARTGFQIDAPLIIANQRAGYNLKTFLLLLPFQLLLLSHHPVGNILLLNFMKQKWKTTFLFHTSAELLPEYPPLVFLPGKTKVNYWIGYMQPKRFYNFNPSCHFFPG